MSAADIAGLLQRTIGLDITSVGLEVVRSAVQQRIKATGSSDETSYARLLQTSPAEIAALVEEVVVPETWFFRHEEAFRLMAQHLTGEWRSRHPDRVATILSIPCSTGEEAYSIAMALMEHGLTAEQFRIDAIDVSRASLTKAKRGVYGNNSFRSNNLNFRQQYFSQTEAGYKLNPDVQRTVEFHHGNILDHAFMQAFTSYDIIFCRNLLIYLDQPSREQTVRLLTAMLNQDGLLFVGHAETGLMWKQLLTPVAHPMSFAYRHRNGSEERTPLREAKRTGRMRRHLPDRIAKKTEARSKPTWKPIPAAETESPKGTEQENGPSLESISRLADRGELKEARQRCEAYLQSHGASAQAYFLLGLIEDIQGNKGEARDSFRKALYLEPDHYETLMHLALLLDQIGDHGGAENLRSRMQRISESEKKRAEL